jgi:hypothetical protein
VTVRLLCPLCGDFVEELVAKASLGSEADLGAECTPGYGLDLVRPAPGMEAFRRLPDCGWHFEIWAMCV